MRIAIVHDYLAQAGGAERVVEAMHDVFPSAPVYTSVYDPEATLPSFKTMDIRTSSLQRWARNSRVHKFALPFYPAAFESFDMTGYDVVLSSTTGFAKGVITGPETCHVCYCHTPARYAWRYHEYVEQGGYGSTAKRVLPYLVHRLRSWDYASAQRVDYFVSNSYNVARRVQKFYGRPSEVLYPPVSTSRFRVLERPSEEFLLVVSRLIGYKRIDLAVEACTRLGIPLKVVGTGPELARLKQMAGPKVEFLGRLPDAAVADLFANCRAFLFPGEEDFGIAPLESMASGRPVVAYGAGGALETVIDGITGVHFHEPTVDSLSDAIRRLDRLCFDPRAIRQHAEVFDVAAFRRGMRDVIERAVSDHRDAYASIGPGGLSRHTIPPISAPVILSSGHGTTGQVDAGALPVRVTTAGTTVGAGSLPAAPATLAAANGHGGAYGNGAAVHANGNGAAPYGVPADSAVSGGGSSIADSRPSIARRAPVAGP
jgi:glycosyltransferase involved in cell wall biosynthesis